MSSYFFQRGCYVNSFNEPRPHHREDNAVAEILKSDYFYNELTGNQMTEVEIALRLAYRAGLRDWQTRKDNRNE